MGRSHLAPEVFNCSGARHRKTWKYWPRLRPPRSISSAGSSRCWPAKSVPALPWTEPAVCFPATPLISKARSFARVTTTSSTAASGYTTQRHRSALQDFVSFMGKTDSGQSGSPSTAIDDSCCRWMRPGVEVLRPIPVFRILWASPDRASEVVFGNVRVPATKHVARRGAWLRDCARPARSRKDSSLHAPDRTLLNGLLRRCAFGPKAASAFGKPVSEQTVTQERIAESRIMIEQGAPAHPSMQLI